MSLSGNNADKTITNDKKIVLQNIFGFHGGVHPEQNKTQTCDKGIEPAPLPQELILPLQQHIGAPASPIVNVGDYVLKGQKIAEAKGFVSAPLHAPSSGIVKAIEERDVQHPSGLAGQCIVIECDQKDEWTQLNPTQDFSSLSAEELLNKIRDAGISGMGGAGFPSSVKLNVPAQKINTLILNSVECEPYITADDVLIREHAKEILIGLDILNQILDVEDILIGIEDNKPEAIEAYKQAINESDPDNVKLAIVPTKYPSGGEKQLIQLLTGKEVPVKGLPADLGIVCQNTGTVFAIYEAVVLGQPLISRVSTLTGNALGQPQNYRALIGTPFRFLLEQAKINWPQLDQLVMGGPMMGFAVHSLDVPVVKTTNCILASAANELSSPELEQPCIRCGSCAEVCPAHLLPQQMYFYSKAKELEKAEEYHINDCIECGACSFVCPSNIPLVQYFRFGKGEIRKKNIELEKSEQSRARFEARKDRLEREAAEKEAARLAKAEARKKKKAEQAKKASAPSEDSLEIAFQLAKTNSAKASKQWKEAEKALEHARKTEVNNIEELEQNVAKLKQRSDEATEAFKKALADKKAAANTPKADAQLSQLEQQIEEAREDSNQASADLKALKKSLISAKSGTADTSELEKQVEQAKALSDEKKTKLRELLKEQKASAPKTKEGADSNSAPQEKAAQPVSEPSEKDKLKIEMASLKAQAKKLKTELEQADEQTKAELEQLIDANKKQLNEVIAKMTELNKQ